ncbi:DNA/RNA non-specific endonuclease [Pantoea sp. JKS000250]|uniref:DNA/RNA non-specific endonuclease n=1 Tax=Pantoea sp. JKS000250 TaxID=1938795 RepID=UPI000D7575A7|nr:DNA/RNA non-specific endonuclease [Pantoea sp. JKS000250]PXW19002.1 endonuclease G [Pantoea sp. JKS000250]
MRRILTLLTVMLLSACSTTHKPQTAIMAVSDNCGVGCPTGGSEQTIIRNAYTLNNNSATKFANWVAYKITKSSQQGGRARNWKQDPDLPASDTLAPSDYNGANAALKVDRGHQAPLAGLGASSDWQSLNYLSNITPQKAALNQGAWVRLEDKERQLANRAHISAVHVVTGPLFERPVGTLPNAPHGEIPSGYWKILYTGSSPAEGKFAAFLMDQETPRASNFCDYEVTVSEIELRTTPHLKVWSGIPEDVAKQIKSEKGALGPDIGCTLK